MGGVYTRVMDQTQPVLVSITDLRRNTGAWFSMGKPLVVIKDSKPIGTYTPSNLSPGKFGRVEDIKKIRKLAGGLKLKLELTTDELNRAYDKQYEEMLPR